ncbi:MAG TPA: TonB-dependent receptor [Longimicrobiales bacterium]|nr:TonB-dependent receptor [Longimicrobiales bacterium]
MLPHWRSAPRPGLLAVVLTVLVCAPLQAQTATTGAVDGRVVDASGAPVLDAIVTIRDASGLEKETDSGRRGVFSFGYLAPGLYQLRVEQIGYAPGLVTGIQVRPGRTRQVEVRLPAAAPADVQPRVVPHQGAVQPATLYGGSQWLPSFAVRSVPSATREPADLLRMSSIADDRWIAEGLPASLSVLRIDGIPFRPAAHPQLPDAGSAFTLTGIESAELVTNGVDVDWSGAAASYLSTQSRHGASAAAVHAAAFWSGDALPSGIDAGPLSHTDVQGGVVVRGPFFADGNQFSLGIEARRLETPVSAAWADTEAAATLAEADPELDLESYRRPAVLSSNAASAFARADWSVGRSHRVELSAHFAAQPDAETVDERGSRLAWQGSDLVAGAALRSAFGASVVNELRVAATRSARERPALDQGIPTRLVSDDLAFGAATASLSSAEDLIVHVSDAVRVASGAHTFEVGAAAALGMYSYEHRENADGAYLFGDVSDFAADSGVFMRAEGGAPLAEWTSPTLSVFAQDRWRALSGLEVMLGVRVDRESLPESDVNRDDEWFQLTGLANNDIGSTSLRISPRAGITWDVNGSRDWVVEAGGGLYYDRVDPQLLAQWQVDDGSALMRRVNGSLSWPDDSAGVTAPRLTMLSSDFDAPRTARLGAGVTRRLAAGTSLSVSAVARRTENLPRQSDLNLLPLPGARDQYGREVYGVLEQHGALLAAAPASGRRFPVYDEVALISDDGWSEYIGVTIGVDRELMDGYGFLLRYTFGRTTDNWVDAARGRWGHSGAPAVGGDPDWEEGTSDFDVPHRGTAAVVLEAPFGVQVSGAYRFQSGRPFTPGFRPGVDADAGGSGTDPAFVDGALAGMSDIIGEWDCLRDAEDAFVERNSCRAAAVHALDIGAALTVLRWGGAAAAITLDAFNVFDSWHEQPDAALYLIDPAGTLTSDPVARTVDVPLLVNSEFGKPLARRHSGRRLRLGLSLNW